MDRKLILGIDVGSTTVKFILARDREVLYSSYERHFSHIREKVLETLEKIAPLFEGEAALVAISGSAGLGLAEGADIPFVQEVFATSRLVKKEFPTANCVVELGGEDAKIIFLKGGIDERMNGTCAGGTGAFLDQMAALLDISVDEMDELSLNSTKLYPIASRCGVFAKTDIQPLINQGARKEDISASIFQAVVNQTIAGLAQGRKMDGTVVFLGGPLYYCKGLQRAFQRTLKLDDEHAVFPEFAPYAVAMGTAEYALEAGKSVHVEELIDSIKNAAYNKFSKPLEPLFNDEAEYKTFVKRHASFSAPRQEIDTYKGKVYLGIDCGSTTTKLVLLGEDKQILYSHYVANKGNPVEIVKEQLKEIYAMLPDEAFIAGSAVTGYGEELIKNAFGVDMGVVETLAHYKAAAYFKPEVDFILDIGGQDIKCFAIKNQAIDSIMLNEACSSGCGSFLAAFANAMGYDVAEFAKAGLFSKQPADLGSRCTVFMNSSVKQAQKEGAKIEDISAGLSVSVVKNALYKVIRAGSADDLGKCIIVQGGTFHNDAVLRAFEKELDREVVRPDIAGLMGSFGAALFSMKVKESTIINKKALDAFEYSSKPVTCNGCENRCRLTVNKFSNGGRFIAGNRCDKALGAAGSKEELPNVYKWKQEYLKSLSSSKGSRGRIGIPMALGIFEFYPLWLELFSRLGFEVVSSGMSNRRIYEKGQFTIPSDTACYPAKIMHGHVMKLIEDGVDAIFYPCMSYNIDEKSSDNHYNCPVVAYYSELLSGNVEELRNTKFLYPYLDFNNKKYLVNELYKSLSESFDGIKKSEVKKAVDAGFKAYEAYTAMIRREGEAALRFAEENKKRVLILAGRPYHVDPEIGHGIDTLASGLGFVVVTEDSVCHLTDMPDVQVLNQWTYHSRLYRAAKFANEHRNVQLVQLVSFGCGVDAITTDEVRRIMEEQGKIYTQIKIDEITNMGAVKIRLRSLIGALEEKNE